MNKEIEKIDDIIKEALTQEEAKFYNELDEQGIWKKIGGLFRGKNAWFFIMMNILNLIMLGIAIYCIIQFFNTESTNELIKWSMIFFFCAMMMSMLKLYAWMQMDKNSIIRELKRLEFQVSILSSKLSK